LISTVQSGKPVCIFKKSYNSHRNDLEEKKMKRKIILVGTLLTAVLITGFSLGLFTRGDQGNPGPAQTDVVTRRDMGSSVLATGIIKPRTGAEVRVGSRVSGILKRLHVNIGDRVEKGQLLGELDETEFNARYNEALASLENARAERNYAVLDLDRQRSLRENNFASQDNVDAAERVYDVAESVIKQAKANLDYARIQLGYTRIKAPISGVVASVSTQEGETVAASFTAPTFVIIIDLERLEVQAYVDETDIGRIEKGQRASFTVDTYPGIDFEGTVTAIYPKAEMKDNVVNYITIIDITGSGGHTLRPEMTTTVRIFQQKRPQVPTVPKQAVFRESGNKYVYVLNGAQQVKRQVDTGWADGKYIEITRGLEQGERIIINQEVVKKW
jgi:RND family efflux transporter MFP subunit